MQEALVLFILCILCIDVQQVDNRANGTGSLFPTGHGDLLFHPRMIRPVAGAGAELVCFTLVRAGG